MQPPSENPPRRGRPPKTREEKLARRREREREYRARDHRRPIARSPYEAELAAIRDLDSTPLSTQIASVSTHVVTDGGRAAPVGSQLAKPDSRLTVHLLTARHPALTDTLTDAQRAHFDQRHAKYVELKVDHLASNSVRAMTADWRHWQAYCLHTGTPVLPVADKPLIAFLNTLIDAGYKRATIDHLLYTLDWVNEWYGVPKLGTEAAFRDKIKDLHKHRLTARQHQATGLTNDLLMAMVDAIDPTNPVHVRDRAMALLTYDGLLRASEVANVRWAHLKPPAVSHPTLLIPFSKTDRTGEGKEVGISLEAWEALQAWRRLCHPKSGHVFHAIPRVSKRASAKRPSVPDDTPPPPMGPHAVRLALQRLAALAGLDDRCFTGHSARVGAAQDLVAKGHTTAAIKHHGRWKSETMPARYAEGVQAEMMAADRFSRLRR